MPNPTAVKKESEKEEETPEEPRKLPKISASVRQRTATLIDLAHTAFVENNPGMDTRFSAAPEGKSTPNVVRAKMSGYRPVRVKELGLAEDGELFGADDDIVRVGDSILMACTDETKKERRDELHARAEKEATISKEVYLESIGQSGAKASGTVKQYQTEEEVKLSKGEKEE